LVEKTSLFPPRIALSLLGVSVAVLLGGCASSQQDTVSLAFARGDDTPSIKDTLSTLVPPWRRDGEDEADKLSPRVVEYGDPVPKGGGVRKIGSPYVVAGRTVVPKADPDYDRAGVASWYGAKFHGRKTANGEIYDMDALTAAHPTLPLPSYVKVTHLANNRSLIVRVNDRGPFARDRVIDLSRRAAKLLGLKKNGTGPVRVSFLKPAPLGGDDRVEQAFLEAQPWYRHGTTRLGSAASAITTRATASAGTSEDG